MSATENKEFIRRYLAAINGNPKTESVIDLFVAEQTLKDHILAFEQAFPLYEMIPDEFMAEGDMVGVRGHWNGVHKGIMEGLPNPPTGKEVKDCDFFITYRIAGGKIVDHWVISDDLKMMHQLGMMP